MERKIETYKILCLLLFGLKIALKISLLGLQQRLESTILNYFLKMYKNPHHREVLYSFQHQYKSFHQARPNHKNLDL